MTDLSARLGDLGGESSTMQLDAVDYRRASPHERLQSNRAAQLSVRLQTPTFRSLMEKEPQRALESVASFEEAQSLLHNRCEFNLDGNQIQFLRERLTEFQNAQMQKRQLELLYQHQIPPMPLRSAAQRDHYAADIRLLHAHDVQSDLTRRIADAAASDDAAVRLEAATAMAVRDTLVRFNHVHMDAHRQDQRKCEFDVEGLDMIIEVTTSEKRHGKIAQIQNNLQNELYNPANKQVILRCDNVSTAAEREYHRIGVAVARSADEVRAQTAYLADLRLGSLGDRPRPYESAGLSA